MDNRRRDFESRSLDSGCLIMVQAIAVPYVLVLDFNGFRAPTGHAALEPWLPFYRAMQGVFVVFGRLFGGFRLADN